MKKIFILAGLAIASLLSLSSCVESFDQSETTAGPSIECIAPTDTKTYVDGLTVKWNEGDVIYVLDAANPKTKKTYTCTGGFGTTKGTFTVAEASKPAFDENTEVYIFTKTGASNTDFYHTDGKWYFTIQPSPTLVGYSSVSDANKLVVPMMAKGKIGDAFSFNHLAALVRLKVTNEYSSPLTISSIRIVSSNTSFGGLCTVLPSSGAIASKAQEFFEAKGSSEIAAGSTLYYDFVIPVDVYTNFSVMIITPDKDVYTFKKASLSPGNGDLFEFTTGLSSSTKDPVKYKISIDGESEVDFYPLKGFPSIPTNCISIRSLVSEEIVVEEWRDVLACFEAVPNPIMVDLTNMTVFGKNFQFRTTTEKIADFYLPSNVTKIGSTARFTGSKNMKLHVSKNLTGIAAIQFNSNNGYVNETSGFVVDSDHPNYSSENGCLYDKAGTTLLQVPTRKSTAIVVKEGVIAIGASQNEYTLTNNQFVETITLPSTLTSISYNQLNIALPKLHTVFCKAENPPTWTGKPAGTGKFVINTGDADQDITSKGLYQTAWGSHLGSWTIVTMAEYTPPTSSSSSSISDLNKDDSYVANIWE